MLGNSTQPFPFLVRDVSSLVLLEPEHEEPAVTLVCCHQGSSATAFAAPRRRYTLFDHVAAQVCIDQALHHLSNGSAKCCVRHFGLAHPAVEVAGYEYSPHRVTISLSVLVSHQEVSLGICRRGTYAAARERTRRWSWRREPPPFAKGGLQYSPPLKKGVG